MLISVISHTDGQLEDEELQHAIRAINRQIAEDYESYWHLGAELRQELSCRLAAPGNDEKLGAPASSGLKRTRRRRALPGIFGGEQELKSSIRC